MSVAQLLSKRERWTTGADAKDSLGNAVLADDTTAVCWCLHGAINVSYPDDKAKVVAKVKRYLEDNNLGLSIRVHNDRLTYAEVMELVNILKL